MPKMEVYLDGSPLVSAGETLGSALEAARREAEDRLIVEVVADGEPVGAAELDDPPDRAPFAGVLEISSAEPLALVRTALLSAAETLNETREHQEEAADLIQVGSTDAAMTRLSDVLQSWEEVNRSVQLARQIGDASEQHERVFEPFEHAVPKLMESLNEIRDGLVRQDHTSVADVLSYDLCDRIEEWREKLITLADELA